MVTEEPFSELALGHRLTPHYERPAVYLLVRLDHVEERELRERLVEAWLLLAPKRPRGAARAPTARPP